MDEVSILGRGLLVLFVFIVIGYFIDKQNDVKLKNKLYGKLNDYKPITTTTYTEVETTPTTHNNKESTINIQQPTKKHYQNNSDDFIDDTLTFFKNIFKFIIMAIVVVSSIALEVAWLSFLFGSVIGCILMLIFFAEGFLLPLGLIPLFSKILYDK